MSDYTPRIPFGKNKIAIVDLVDIDLLNNKWRDLSGYADGYGTAKNKYAERFMHRIILSRKLNRPLDPSEFVDHINGDRSDNRRENLRVVTKQQNCSNCKTYKNNKSGYKGVTWSNGANKWRARIRVAKKEYHLGIFDTPEEAYAVYVEAAKKHFGEFARFEQ